VSQCQPWREVLKVTCSALEPKQLVNFKSLEISRQNRERDNGARGALVMVQQRQILGKRSIGMTKILATQSVQAKKQTNKQQTLNTQELPVPWNDRTVLIVSQLSLTYPSP